MRALAVFLAAIASADALLLAGRGLAPRINAGHALTPRIDAGRLRRPAVATSMSVADKADGALAAADDTVVARGVRVANHASALASLAYFGLVSSTMAAPNARMPMATLASVITRRVGPTTNAQFSEYFATLVTPAPYVFLIWPAIAALQSIAVAVSILRPSLKAGDPQNSWQALNTLGTGEPLSQMELAALSLANAAATLWLFASSNALVGALPLASVLILPFVPLLAGYPLRAAAAPPSIYTPVFQVFSSFTAVATCLAVAVECQYGGRVPFLGGRAELCGCLFLSLVGGLVALPKRSLARRAVTCFALSGVVARRLGAGGGAAALLRSPSFVGALALLAWALKKLLVADE